MKELGVSKHEYMCTCSSLKKGKSQLALGILQQMYGPDKKWKELCDEMIQMILDAREERGAGEKPVLRKYQPDADEKENYVQKKEDGLSPMKPNSQVLGDVTNIQK
jgi:hypothetical protein